MTEHVHRCLTCTPDMVPDFSRDDPRYHNAWKCRPPYRSLAHVVILNGDPIAYTSSHFEDREGWALFVGATLDEIHQCPCGSKNLCCEARFGTVTSEHQELD